MARNRRFPTRNTAHRLRRTALSAMEVIRSRRNLLAAEYYLILSRLSMEVNAESILRLASLCHLYFYVDRNINDFPRMLPPPRCIDQFRITNQDENTFSLNFGSFTKIQAQVVFNLLHLNPVIRTTNDLACSTEACFLLFLKYATYKCNVAIA
jgi:hypothetical protein